MNIRVGMQNRGCRSGNDKTLIGNSMKISQNTFNCGPMIFSGSVHKLADLVNCKSNIRT
ncbi:hypothetical protein Hanom_Chr15g01385461 [Helianthus anomalus]